MSQQMINGSHYEGSTTFTVRMSNRYAVVGEPFHGKHAKPQDAKSLIKRKLHWVERKQNTDEITVSY